jgi:hypothetical protein
MKTSTTPPCSTRLDSTPLHSTREKTPKEEQEQEQEQKAKTKQKKRNPQKFCQTKKSISIPSSSSS